MRRMAFLCGFVLALGCGGSTSKDLMGAGGDTGGGAGGKGSGGASTGGASTGGIGTRWRRRHEHRRHRIGGDGGTSTGGIGPGGDGGMGTGGTAPAAWAPAAWAPAAWAAGGMGTGGMGTGGMGTGGMGTGGMGTGAWAPAAWAPAAWAPAAWAPAAWAPAASAVMRQRARPCVRRSRGRAARTTIPTPRASRAVRSICRAIKQVRLAGHELVQLRRDDRQGHLRIRTATTRSLGCDAQLTAWVQCSAWHAELGRRRLQRLRQDSVLCGARRVLQRAQFGSYLSCIYACNTKACIDGCYAKNPALRSRIGS